MKFWGVEVEAGEKVPVPVEDGHLIHVSQVTLGDVKNPKSANYVPVRMEVEDKKFVIGTLSADKGSQLSFDLVLDKDFVLSHDWKDGSIYFCGYTAEQEDDGSEGPGVEVKAREKVPVHVEDGHLIHVSQNPKSANYVPVRMEVDDCDDITSFRTNMASSGVDYAGLRTGMEAKNFNYEEYQKFYTSFRTNVASSVGGTMGHLYNVKYGGILKVLVNGDKCQTHGTAFVIFKSHVYVLLTCNHLFNKSNNSHSVEVVSSDFKYFKAEVGYQNEDMDVCLLIVRDDMGPNVLELETCDAINFGEDICSVSCPRYEMRVDQPPSPSGSFDYRFLNTLWFTMNRGYVCHPFLVGIDSHYLEGTYIQLQGGQWNSGASGAPVFNLEGKVIGMLIASSDDDSMSYFVNHWALRLSSFRDYLEDRVSMGRKSLKGRKSLRKVVRRWWKGQPKRDPQ